MKLQSRTRRIRTVGLAVAAVATLISAASVDAGSGRQDGSNGHGNNGKGAANSQMVDLQILAVNDFHGGLDTRSSSFGGTGGVEYLAAKLRAAEAGAAGETVIVSAGDLIGATPLLSALFHDEPTIEAANMFGLDINGVGNHEFDEGKDELLRMAYGGSHPIDTDLDGDGFAGADFEFLAANVVVDATGETLFAPYKINNYSGVRVAFIGMTLEGTPNIVTPSGVAGLTFKDEVETVNALVPELRKRGVEAIVVLLHEGGFTNVRGGENDCNGGLVGPIADIVPALDDAVDIVIAGHTNSEFICELDGKLVTMADNAGRIFTDIDVKLNRVTKDIEVVSAVNVRNSNGLGNATAPDLEALIAKYKVIADPLANIVVGQITGNIPEFPKTAAGESPIGDLIADAQLASTTSAATGGAVVAFMNPGGIRTDNGYVFASSPAGEGDGNVTYGEAFEVQPFGNSLVTMTLTGQQIHDLLEQQWPSGNVLQVSNGFTYTWNAGAAPGNRVDPSTIKLNGVVLGATTQYRVTVNSFLADGGDGFSVLIQGTNRLGGDLDIDSMVAYFAANPPIDPPAANRISVIPAP